MNGLNLDWIPEFGIIYTWLAMDKFGRIGVMVNNCFGDLPKQLLKINGIERLLDNLNEYIWEESKVFINYPIDKKGDFMIDGYSYWRNPNIECKEKLYSLLKLDLIESGHYSEVNLAVNKGFFIFHSVEGSLEGEDYPVGYDGKTVMGDYFRYLMPTNYASIEDFPTELQAGIVVSKKVDFMVDRLFPNHKIDDLFTEMYDAV